MLYTIEGKNSFYSSFLRMSLNRQVFSSNNLQPSTAFLNLFLRAYAKICAPLVLRKLRFWEFDVSKNPVRHHHYYNFSKNLFNIYSSLVFLKM